MAYRADRARSAIASPMQRCVLPLMTAAIYRSSIASAARLVLTKAKAASGRTPSVVRPSSISATPPIIRSLDRTFGSAPRHHCMGDMEMARVSDRHITAT
jgi:hypothetical protein